MAAIRTGLETAMEVTVRRPMARGKLVDLILIVGAGRFVIATAGMTALGEFVQRAAGNSTLTGIFLRLATFVISIGVILLVYRFVPVARTAVPRRPRGAVVTALLLQAIAFASGLIYDKTTSLSISTAR